MRAATYGAAADILGNRLPDVWSARAPRTRFGDAAVLLFLVVQCLDGVLTYIGVTTYGIAIEGNPILATLMETAGHVTALVSAKIVAAALGIALHLAGIHSVVAFLAVFYIAAAILPWTAILFVGVGV
jgi:hypothetical protein